MTGLYIMSFLLAFVFNSQSDPQVANLVRKIKAETNSTQKRTTDGSEGSVPVNQDTRKNPDPPVEGGPSFAIGGAEWEEGQSAKRVVKAIVYADLMAVGKKFATQASSQVDTLEAAERIVTQLKAAFDVALTSELATSQRADVAARNTVAPATAGAVSATASARAPATAGGRGRGNG
ncbi:unnamed protein product, partial [Laminaria digitata]